MSSGIARSPSLAFQELRPALHYLDTILGRAVERARTLFAAPAGAERFRGLYISDADVDEMLARDAGAFSFGTADDAEPPEMPERLQWLASTFGLDELDVKVVLLALAPEIDLRYERIYAYLQDDVSRRRASVDLALSLFCASSGERANARANFASGSRLVRGHLISLGHESGTDGTPLLSHSLQVDEQIVNLLLGIDVIDARIAGCSQLLEPGDGARAPTLADAPRHALAAAVARVREMGESLRLHFHGPVDTGRRSAARVIAADVGARVFELDIARLLATHDAGARATIAVREAWLRHAVLVLAECDALALPENVAVRASLEDALLAHTGVVVMVGTEHRAPFARAMPAIALAFARPSTAIRREMWVRAAERSGAALDDRALDALASTFRLTSRQIDRASDAASASAWWRGSIDAPEIGDWLAGARAQGGDELASLATRVLCAHEWSDIVLPDDALAQLREIKQRIASKRTVMDSWGFDRRMTRGRGVNALFSGPSGTGKTMAAEVLARELGLDLFRIELAAVVSKYIGETEKNLDRIFVAAEQANGILLFDEADALFGKRSEVRDSHDRYANLEISYLLQKMEQFDGIAILATNLRANLDEAFIRRLAFTIHFPFPDAASRRRIWTTIWPAETPLSPAIDFEFLSHQFALSGGNIKNIALGAAFFAAEGGDVVTMRDLMRATFREYQKLGKTLDATELGAYASELM
ncbi:MAG TPA: ATP-binding protein [Gemmatimonadaceae bacterium]|jgi:AAA+ superfamily predicted ATPase|nr:ATP-binding protein [Gemmatimonadaceae bacterium]